LECADVSPARCAPYKNFLPGICLAFTGGAFCLAAIAGAREATQANQKSTARVHHSDPEPDIAAEFTDAEAHNAIQNENSNLQRRTYL
jgi:hypothetical protein